VRRGQFVEPPWPQGEIAIGDDGVIRTATTGRAYITSSGLRSTTTTQSPAATTASGLVIRTTTPGG